MAYIITIPSEVQMALKPNELAIYTSIRSCADNGRGICYASAQEIAARAKVDRKTVYQVAKHLIKLGFLKRIGRRVGPLGGKPVNHYRILDLLKPEEYGHETDLPVGTFEPHKSINKASLASANFSLKGNDTKSHVGFTPDQIEKAKEYIAAKNREQPGHFKSPNSPVLIEKIARDEFPVDPEKIALKEEYEKITKGGS